MFRSRSKAREDLIKLFYQMDMNGDFSELQKSTYFEQKAHDEDENENSENENKHITEKEFIDVCTNILLTNKGDIDERIQKASPKWNLNRFSKVDLAILRLAVSELCYTDIPVQVAINEAIELGKKFSNEEENKIIHGILGTVAKAGKVDDIYIIDENDK